MQGVFLRLVTQVTLRNQFIEELTFCKCRKGKMTTYTWHLNAIKACITEKQLDAVRESIIKTVPPTHPDLPELVSAGKIKREEINGK